MEVQSEPQSSDRAAAGPETKGKEALSCTANNNPRLAALATQQAKLESNLAELQAQRARYVAEAKLPSGLDMPSDWTEEQKSKQALATANATVQEHIAFLHRYNEIKDIGQGLMGLVADKRGVRIAAVMEEFGMDPKD